MHKKVLDISPSIPYKGVGHAGGKCQYYYLKKLENECDFEFISTLIDTEYNKFSEGKIKGNYHLLTRYIGIKKFSDLFIKTLLKIQRNFVFDKYIGLLPFDFEFFIFKNLKRLKKNGYEPDYIILEWTEITFLVRKIRKLFPNARYICNEVDVTFLRYLRRLNTSKNFFSKIKNKIEYIRMKKKELSCLQEIDEVLVLNEKDKQLLIDESFPANKIRAIVNYFDLYYQVQRNIDKDTIIFYGAMVRPENCEACEWFINNVFNTLPDNFKFIIIGYKPQPSILKYQNDRIIVTGFVDDVSVYFAKCLCSVVPLFNGAGIKTKIQESMSAGVPVLTNEIGIEGIPARNGYEYFHCNTAEDYRNVILSLSSDIKKAEEVGKAAQLFIRNNFSYENHSYIIGEIK